MMKKFVIYNLWLMALIFHLPLAYAEPRQATFAQVERAFLRGSYEKTIDGAVELIEAKSEKRDELYYLKALSELKTKKFSDARDSFKNILSKFPTSRRIFDAHLGIGDSYLLAGDVEKAIEKYKEILKEYPDDKNISAVYYRLGNSFERSGLKGKAKEYFDKVKISSPLSFEARMIKASGEKEDAVSKESSGYYSVQVGCFEKRRNAEQLTQKLSDRGYDGYMEISEKKDARLYKVKVGRFKTKKEAESSASRLKKDGYSIKLCQEE